MSLTTKDMNMIRRWVLDDMLECVHSAARKNGYPVALCSLVVTLTEKIKKLHEEKGTNP